MIAGREADIMEHIDFPAIGAAGIAGFAFGALWYTVLGKAWMKASGVSPDQARPAAAIMGLTFVCQIVIAFAMYGMMFHIGAGLAGAVLSAVLVWAGFILTTQIVNHRFQGRPWLLTAIDTGHWLGVLLVQALVLSLLG